MFIIIGIVLLIICLISTIIAKNEETELETNEYLLSNRQKTAEKNKKLHIAQITAAMSAMVAMVCIVTSLMVAEKEMITSEIDYTVHDTAEIYTLKDNTSTEGSFFLGSGSVNNKRYYCYYVLTEDGYQECKVSPDNYKVYINFINNNETPHIDTLYKTETKTVNSKYYWLVNVKACIHPEQYKVGTIKSTKHYTAFKKYKIYIPEGSIDKEYKIDME